MKKPPDNPEFARFTEAMRTIMQAPRPPRYEPVKRKPKTSASLDSGASSKAATQNG